MVGIKKSGIFYIWPSLSHFVVGIDGDIERDGRVPGVRYIGYGYIWQRCRGFFYGWGSRVRLLYCQGSHMKWGQGSVWQSQPTLVLGGGQRMSIETEGKKG